MKVNNDENIKKLADKEFLKKLYQILELMGWDYGIDYSEASNFVRWIHVMADEPYPPLTDQETSQHGA